MDKDKLNKSFYQFYRTQIYLDNADEELLKRELLEFFTNILYSLNEDERFELLFELQHSCFNKLFDEIHRVEHMEEKWDKNVSRRLGDDDPCRT